MTNRPLRLPSLSSLSRHLACPGAVVLPRKWDEPSADMDAGTAGHLWLEHAVRDNEDRADSELSGFGKKHPRVDVTAVRDLCQSVDLSEILQGREILGVEQAFAYHPGKDTARILGNSIGREYLQNGWRPTEEIPGTADLVLRDGPRVVVVDYKFASYYDGYHRPSWEAQVSALALCAARAYGADEAEGAVVVIQRDEPLRWQRHTLDVWDLAAWADRLSLAVAEWRTAHARAQTGRTPDTREGEHCAYCPCYQHCPAKHALAASLASGSLLRTLHEPRVTVASLADACARYADAREAHKQIGRQLDAVRDTLWGELHNAGREARTPSGRTFRAVQSGAARQLREVKGGGE